MVTVFLVNSTELFNHAKHSNSKRIKNSQEPSFMKNLKKAVVLFSGGLDSTTCLAIAKNQNYEIFALSFNYHQRHCAELEAAKKITAHYQIQHKIFDINIDQFGGSALTNLGLPVPDYQDNNNNNNKNIPITYVPARNTIFLSIALAYAEVLQAEAIFIGVSAVDYSGYPDCRPEYIQAFQNLADLATKTGVENKNKKILIKTPLINLSKAETIQLGIELNTPYELTVSCYQANSEGQACGRCDSCILRKKGFLAANYLDPTKYAK